MGRVSNVFPAPWDGASVWSESTNSLVTVDADGRKVLFRGSSVFATTSESSRTRLDERRVRLDLETLRPFGGVEVLGGTVQGENSGK